MRRSVSLAALLLAGFAEPPPLLAIDPLFFAEEGCLAPEFTGSGCPAPVAAAGHLPTASAALLAPDLGDPAPMLALDVSVLREGAEVTGSS